MRLFNLKAGIPLPDPSTKQFAFVVRDGAALVTYSGLGRLPTGEHISDLIANLLRGEMRDMNGTLSAIAAFATNHIAPIALGIPPEFRQHTFAVAGHRHGRPFFAEVRNVDVGPVGHPSNQLLLRKDFTVAVVAVPQDGIASVVGARDYLGPPDRALLNRIRGVRPARAGDFLKLLAAVTKRTAQAAPELISPECWAWHLPVGSNQPEAPQPFTYGRPIVVSSTPRMITHGLDFNAAMDFIKREQAKYGDWSEWQRHFGQITLEAMRLAMRLEVGQRVKNLDTNETGRVALDPVPGGDINDIGVVWDSDTSRVDIASRSRISAIV